VANKARRDERPNAEVQMTTATTCTIIGTQHIRIRTSHKLQRFYYYFIILLYMTIAFINCDKRFIP
jgi:hypothetical protein